MRAMLREYGDSLAHPSVIEIMLPSWLPAPRDFARLRFRHRWLGLIEEIITARQEKTAHPEQGTSSDLLDLMATDPVSGRPASRRRLADQVATMIAAGHATTAVALFWALFLVASAHSVQTRIAAEVASIDLGPESAADALIRLVYTRATVQEALRLYPPAYSIFRVARKSDEAGGIAIPKGAIVMVAP